MKILLAGLFVNLLAVSAVFAALVLGTAVFFLGVEYGRDAHHREARKRKRAQLAKLPRVNR